MGQQLPNPAKFIARAFRLPPIKAINPMRGGDHQSVEMGERLWVCDIETTPLSRGQSGSWKWLLAKLAGVRFPTLFLYDSARPRPLAYHDQTDTRRRIGRHVRIASPLRIGEPAHPWGNVVIIEIDRANSRIKLRASIEISDGDYIAWDDGPARRLHIMGAASVVGEGWVDVEPAPPATSSSVPAPATLHRAAAEMVVAQSGAAHSAPVIHQVTLQAGQIIRRS